MLSVNPRSRTLLTVATVLVLVLSASIVTLDIATAGSRGNPTLSAHAPDNELSPGDDTTFELFISNGGDVDYADSADGRSRVTTARDVRLTLEADDAPLEVETGTKPVGNIGEGVSSALEFEVSVDEDAKPGIYELELEAEYSYTNQISGATSPVYSELDRTRTFTVDVEITKDARFEIIDTTTETFDDGTGSVTVEVENIGRETAHASRFSLTSQATRLTFDGAATAETFVGEWAPNEIKKLSFEGDLAKQADRRQYLFTGTVNYEDDDGESQTSDTLYTGATPGERDSQFEITSTQSNVAIGDTGNLTVHLRNTADEPVRNARLALTSEDPKLNFAGTRSATTYIGEFPANSSQTVKVEATVSDGADIRQYPITGTMTFVDTAGDTRQSDELLSAVIPRPAASQFAIENASANVAAGESGPITLQLQNTGETVRDARLQIASSDPKLTFSGENSIVTYVGLWEHGETRTFSYTANIGDRGDIRPYPVSASVTYRTSDGETRSSEPAVTGINPRLKRFDVENIQSTLAVGEERTLRGQIVNTGETRVRNAVVVFESSSQTVNPIETEYRIGTLGPGERAPFSFDIDISDTAAGGPRQFTMQVRYRDANDDVRQSDPLDVKADIDNKRDAFRVEAVKASFEKGETGAFRLRVTNTGNQTISDISAKLFTSDPLASDDDEAFIPELAPGESSRIVFELSVGQGAMTKIYPAELDFQYDDVDGDTLLSDTYKVPVQVTEPSGDGPSPLFLVGIVLVVLLAAGGGYYWFRIR